MIRKISFQTLFYNLYSNKTYVTLIDTFLSLAPEDPELPLMQDDGEC